MRRFCRRRLRLLVPLRRHRCGPRRRLRQSSHRAKSVYWVDSSAGWWVIRRLMPPPLHRLQLRHRRAAAVVAAAVILDVSAATAIVAIVAIETVEAAKTAREGTPRVVPDVNVRRAPKGRVTVTHMAIAIAVALVVPKVGVRVMATAAAIVHAGRVRVVARADAIATSVLPADVRAATAKAVSETAGTESRVSRAIHTMQQIQQLPPMLPLWRGQRL